jgi:hypothetical protein
MLNQDAIEDAIEISLRIRIAQLEVERTHYRMALKKIAMMEPGAVPCEEIRSGTIDCPQCEEIIEIARIALEREVIL